MKQKAKGGLTLASSSLQVIIADDYSDPFDAKNDLKSKVGKGESAGYMEPYEAQRIMTGKQSSWHKDLSSAGRQRAYSWTHGWSPASLSRGRFVLSRWWLGGCSVFNLHHNLPVHVHLHQEEPGRAQ